MINRVTFCEYDLVRATSRVHPRRKKGNGHAWRGIVLSYYTTLDLPLLGVNYMTKKYIPHSDWKSMQDSAECQAKLEVFNRTKTDKSENCGVHTGR